jgi:hypothetical protein
MKPTLNRLGLASALALLIPVFPLANVATRADVTITIAQSGSEVDLSGSGTLNLTALTLSIHDSNQLNGVAGVAAFAVVGPPIALADRYDGVTGPMTIGPGDSLLGTSGTGMLFGVEGDLHSIFVPTGYTSGSLSGTATFANTTLSGLGLTPGTYTWNWGTGSNADSLTVLIETPTVVPEPSTAVVAVFGAVAFAAYGWRRHLRAQRRQAAA